MVAGYGAAGPEVGMTIGALLVNVWPPAGRQEVAEGEGVVVGVRVSVGVLVSVATAVIVVVIVTVVVTVAVPPASCSLLSCVVCNTVEPVGRPANAALAVSPRPSISAITVNIRRRDEALLSLALAVMSSLLCVPGVL
jgi:hypothetical protein